jgi:pimeloyl-ACP methyl ester carboxylesterase
MTKRVMEPVAGSRSSSIRAGNKEDPMTSTTAQPPLDDPIAAHHQAGRVFRSRGIECFVREAGDGEPVVFVHGMWGASFLYRKVLQHLTARGLRGIAFDLPGFGFAERPSAFDYTWTGLGEFAVGAVDALGLGDFHLVVHDIGGPVGFELISRRPDRVKSLTVMNTMIEVTRFNPPWSMRPFRRRVLGPLWLRSLNRPAFRALMRLQGIDDPGAVTRTELDAYLALMRRADGGRAFLRVMRGAERSPEKQHLYRSVVGSNRYPVQVIWARNDPALPLATYGQQAARAAGVQPRTLPGRHFPQEDHPHDVAAAIASFIIGTPAVGETFAASCDPPT